VTDRQTIREVIAGAMDAEQRVDLMPPPYEKGMAIPNIALRAMRSHVQSECARFYTEPRLSQVTSILEIHLGEQQYAGSDREVGGGVDSLTITGLQVQGDTAIARADVVKWLDYIHFALDGAHVIHPPHLLARYYFRLARSDFGWRISFEDFNFPPGSGP